MNQNAPMDIVSLIALLFTAIINVELANALAPQIAIIMFSLAGSIARVCSSNEEMTRLQGAKEIAGRAFIAFTVTVSIAMLIAMWWPVLEPRYTISPIAFLIGYVKDYRALFCTALDLVLKARGRS